MKKTYQVSEAADELETEVYTLRYWENQLGIEVPRNNAGHRYYEEEQIVLFRGVKRLKEAGFTLRQMKAMAERISAVAALSDEKLEELRRRIAGMETEQEEAALQKESNAGAEDTKHEVAVAQKDAFSLCVGETAACVSTMQEERLDGVRLLQEGMTRWLGEMLQKNNEQLSQKIEEGVSERMARELRFLFRQQEEREEERYRRLDRTIREHQQARANAKQQTSSLENFLLTRKVRPLH
ncbi:MAG: MerR family transcriptional regulator [Lachnospiraceae bacterium]|nr:MerR family transcriptional regulator [Lachnospiraceae bacterium]